MDKRRSPAGRPRGRAFESDGKKVDGRVINTTIDKIDNVKDPVKERGN